jgi:amino acid transporter
MEEPKMADVLTSPQSGAPGGTRLRANCLNFWEVLAQAIALISPTMTAALIVPAMYGNAGNGSWLAYAFGTVMLLFVALNLNEFARRSTTSGSMFAYTTRGLGPTAGGLAGWCLIWAYLFIGIAGLTGFTNFANVLLAMLPGGHVQMPPLLLYAICAAVSWICAYRDIQLSTILMLVLEGVSVAFILVLAAIVLFHAGFPIDTDQLTLKSSSISNLGFGVVIAIFSLVGFECATAFGDEAKAPLKTIPKAVIWSLLLTGVFFVFITYMEVYGTRGSKTTLDNLTAPLNTLADMMHVSWLSIPISIGAMISFFSLNLSCVNACSRVLFPMGKHGVFHGAVGQAHAKNETPHIAVTIAAGMMLAVVCGMTLWHPVVTDVFNFAGTFGAFGFLFAYFFISVAAPVYLKKIGELKPKNVVISVIAVLLLLVPAVGSVYTNPPLTPPVSYFPYIFLGYFLVGLAWLLAIRGKSTASAAKITGDLEAPTAVGHSRVAPVSEGAVA